MNMNSVIGNKEWDWAFLMLFAAPTLFLALGSLTVIQAGVATGNPLLWGVGFVSSFLGLVHIVQRLGVMWS